jgi:RNA polymerase sigma factor (sigma-70 family)
MASGRGAVIRQVDTLFRIGSLRAVPDGHLLERFVARRDGGEAAFETLVARHGPMVLGVCRQILVSPHDAEDAFQATFLVLVRRAGAIRKRDSLGPWLHGVARRVSLRAKTNAARRKLREGASGIRAAAGARNGQGSELVASLHDEIARLPEKYRSPIVLCDLEGHTHAEAAERLQWPVGTVSGRLFRAREILRGRISRRGIALSVTGAVGALAAPARAAVPSALVRWTRIAADRCLDSVALVPLKFFASAPLAAAVLAVAGINVLAPEAPTAAAPISQAAKAPEPNAVTLTRLPSSARGLSTVHPPRDPAEVTSLAVSADGRLLAAGCRGATITIWDLTTGIETATLAGNTAPILSIAFLGPDNDRLASSSEDRLLTFWDVPSGKPLISAQLPQMEQPLVLGPEPKGSTRGGLGRG